MVLNFLFSDHSKWVSDCFIYVTIISFRNRKIQWLICVNNVVYVINFIIKLAITFIEMCDFYTGSLNVTIKMWEFLLLVLCRVAE